MKINGKSYSDAYVETILMVRGNDIIAFKATAILDYEQFEKMVPEAKPPIRIMAGSTDQIPQYEDPDYLKAISDRAKKRHAWMCIKSILATPGIEFETVKLDDPGTWLGWEAELLKSFTRIEVNRLYNGILSAQGLNQAKLDQAEADFLSSSQRNGVSH